MEPMNCGRVFAAGCGRVFTFCCVFDKDVDACFSCERTGSCFCCVFDKRTQPGRRKIWQEGWDNKYMIWQVGGGLAGMDGVSRIAGIAGWDGGAKHFYGFFCPPEGTFEHYQHFYIRLCRLCPAISLCRHRPSSSFWRECRAKIPVAEQLFCPDPS